MNERERIELLMRCYNLTSSQFADRTGIQRASVSHIIGGRNKPSLEVMLKIYDAFPGIDMKWLMTGVGEAPVPVSSAEQEADTLFSTVEESQNSVTESKTSAPNLVRNDLREAKQDLPVRTKTQPSDKPVRRNVPQQRSNAHQQSIVQQKKIKEVRIFYTDGTYETLVPEL